jgi:predicted deacylase
MSMHSVLGDAKDIEPGRALDVAVKKHAEGPLGPITRSRGLGPYRGYGELLVAISHLARRGARLLSYGRSAEGEPLFALHFGRAETLAPRSHARTAVLLAGLHPSEWIGVETALVVAERLVGVDLGDRAVLVAPLTNPDGVRRVERNLRVGRRRFVRHNARGVDLNRNFDAAWGELGLVQRALSWVFSPGERPHGEPEVEGLAHLLSPLRVDRAISLHSYGGAVLYPRASSRRPIHDEREHVAWAKRIAAACDPKRPYAHAACARWAKGITAGGLELDWFHERHGAISLLVECSRGGRGLTPSRLLDPFAWFNPPKVAETASAIADGVVPFVKGLEP